MKGNGTCVGSRPADNTPIDGWWTALLAIIPNFLEGGSGLKKIGHRPQEDANGASNGRQ